MPPLSRVPLGTFMRAIPACISMLTAFDADAEVIVEVSGPPPSMWPLVATSVEAFEEMLEKPNSVMGALVSPVVFKP